MKKRSFKVGDLSRDSKGREGKVIQVLDPKVFCFEYEVEFIAPKCKSIEFYFGDELKNT